LSVRRLATSAPGYVLGLLTALSFFNYLDRMVMAILVEPIKRDLGLSDTQMGLLSGFAFALLGPVAVGVISDLLAPTLGIESLRYALITTTVIPFWAAVHFWLAARSSRGWKLQGAVRKFA
jgi:hypothetical protein